MKLHVFTHLRPSFSPARLAVTVVFFINGFVFSNWVPRIPAIQQHRLVWLQRTIRTTKPQPFAKEVEHGACFSVVKVQKSMGNVPIASRIRGSGLWVEGARRRAERQSQRTRLACVGRAAAFDEPDRALAPPIADFQAGTIPTCAP